MDKYKISPYNFTYLQLALWFKNWLQTSSGEKKNTNRSLHAPNFHLKFWRKPLECNINTNHFTTSVIYSNKNK